MSIQCRRNVQIVAIQTYTDLTFQCEAAMPGDRETCVRVTSSHSVGSTDNIIKSGYIPMVVVCVY